MVLVRLWLKLFILFAVADIVIPLVENTTLSDFNNDLKGLDFRRRSKKKSRSTSSSSGDPQDSSEDSGQSLDLTISSSSSSIESGSKQNRYKPKSSAERRGWRKWHRKCPPCPEDMVKKWRDKSIKWICGGYQRARRSFKSDCMMHYRNCQDGTMFVKIHDHRCQNDTGKEFRRGLHFFYEYGQDSQDSRTQTSESDLSSELTDFL